MYASLRATYVVWLEIPSWVIDFEIAVLLGEGDLCISRAGNVVESMIYESYGKKL